MKTRVIVIYSLAVILLGGGFPLPVFATSYQPLFHLQDREGAAMKTGQTVHLFHSGTGDVRKAIRVNDTLTVYRTDTSCEVKEVGKVRAIAYLGETYLKAVVVEGEIKPDDIARIKSVSCLVISAGICEH